VYCKLVIIIHPRYARAPLSLCIYTIILDDAFKLHGLPEEIISDRDSKFTGNFWQALFESLGMRLGMSTAFHPQTDGQTERMNRTLEDMLRHYVGPDHDDWEELLSSCEFAVNNAYQDSIKTTPFLLILWAES
jgi:transposase InsO family protein